MAASSSALRHRRLVLYSLACFDYFQEYHTNLPSYRRSILHRNVVRAKVYHLNYPVVDNEYPFALARLRNYSTNSK